MNLFPEPGVLPQGFVAAMGEHISCSSIASLGYYSQDRLTPKTPLDSFILDEMISGNLDATGWQQLLSLVRIFRPF